MTVPPRVLLGALAASLQLWLAALLAVVSS